MQSLPLADVQAVIMHTYRPRALRVFVLRVRNAEAARRFLGGLVSGDPSSPQLATADQWRETHASRVNVGITHAGLAALGVPDASLRTFPEEFAQGAVGAAERVGDTGESAPERWDTPFTSPDIHLLVFLFATDAQTAEATIDAESARLRQCFGATGACEELAVRDARSLPRDRAHFGYRDGFSQPTIEGGPPPLFPDVLPEVPAGEFLLGYDNHTADTIPEPPELRTNGSYAAVRILEQDCDAFEVFLAAQAARTNLDPELIAAKLCGRWRSGAPLTLFPNADDPQRDDPGSLARYNSFDYKATESYNPGGEYDDTRGQVCPVGAHIRRMNPRNSPIAGNSGLSHRIVRRGLPYGPPHDPANPNDGIARGLLGLFIGASLKNQFEFLMKHWANSGSFTGLGQTKDPIIGDNATADSKFVVPMRGAAPGVKAAPVVMTGLPRFVTTRGGVYCFLPGVTAIRYLAGLHHGAPGAPPTRG